MLKYRKVKGSKLWLPLQGEGWGEAFNTNIYAIKEV